MEEEEVGVITHYYGHINVAVIELSNAIQVGDTIRVKGHSSDFTQRIESMQVERMEVSEAGFGETVGVKVEEKAHPHDKVYKVSAA